MSPVFAHGQLRLYLLALLNEGPRHGYEVIQDLEQRFHGLYTPSAGTVYPRLAKLEQEGLVERTDEGRKATYRITDAGRAEVASRRGDLADLHDDLERSVRDLAEEVRERVQGRSADLRAELKAAARAARADAVPAGGGWPGSGGSPGGGWSDLERAMAELRSQARGGWSTRGLSAEQIGEVLGILTDASARIREVVTRGR